MTVCFPADAIIDFQQRDESAVGQHVPPSLLAFSRGVMLDMYVSLLDIQKSECSI